MAALVLAFVHLAGGDIDRAIDHAELAVERAPVASETAWRFGPHLIRGMVRDVLGDTEGALADLSRATGYGDDIASAVRVPFRHVLTANALFRAGRWDDAQAEVDAGLGACDDLDVRAPEAWLVSTAALLALGRDGVAPAKEIVARAGTAQLGADQVVWTTGLIAALEGDLAAALSMYALVAEIGDALGSRTSVALVAADLVRTALALGDTARVEWLCDAFGWADGSRSIPMRGHHLWATGLATGDPARAALAADVLGPVRPFDAARASADVARLLAPADPVRARALRARRAGRLRRARRDDVRQPRPHGHGVGRDPLAHRSACGSSLRLGGGDRHRTPGAGTAGRGLLQRIHRRAAVHVTAYGRVAPRPRLREGRHLVEDRVGPPPRRPRRLAGVT